MTREANGYGRGLETARKGIQTAEGDQEITDKTENKTAKAKQVPDFYVFENGTNDQKGGKPAGAVFAHKKGKGFTLLVGGKRYVAFPPRAKAADAKAAEVTEASGA